MPTSKCLLAALAKGHYGFTGKPEDLDAVVINTKGAYGCRHVITATVRELFDQPDYGGSMSRARLTYVVTEVVLVLLSYSGISRRFEWWRARSTLFYAGLHWFGIGRPSHR
jgi:hypothetical protein